jgi:hypothetical protein
MSICWSMGSCGSCNVDSDCEDVDRRCAYDVQGRCGNANNSFCVDVNNGQCPNGLSSSFARRRVKRRPGEGSVVAK